MRPGEGQGEGGGARGKGDAAATVMSSSKRPRGGAPGSASKDEFSDLKTKVYDRTKQRILGDLENLRNGKHPGFTERVLGFRRDREDTLKFITDWHETETLRINTNHEATCARIQQEADEKLKNLETKIRQDFEACKAELQEERQSADAQQELIRDVAKPHFSLRPQNSRKRPRRHLLDVDDGESDGFTSTKPGSSTSKAKRNKKFKDKDMPPPQRLARDDGLLADHEIDADIRFFNRPKQQGSRGRRPPKMHGGKGSSR